ncbi:MAG TPA: exodeoxyribonuclease III [Burkholderiales bacterium]|nr:exodeoxyribonuclease III [Burkholderiales bacterium]
MRLAAWNVNSLKIRLPQVAAWLSTNRPDVLCLQETKIEDEKFPLQDIQAAGYHALFSGQKTYNGVAILSKQPGVETISAIPAFNDAQKRVLAATIDSVRVICVYAPNGQSVDSDKYRYKLEWLAAFNNWLKDELVRYPQLAVLGDLNIAPEDRDVHDPLAWEGNVLVSPRERQAFRELLKLGLKDSFRLFEQPEKSFSWWDYRLSAFRRNLGLRIDHILLSSALASCCKSSTIDTKPRQADRPSDHAPVLADI